MLHVMIVSRLEALCDFLRLCAQDCTNFIFFPIYFVCSFCKMAVLG
uniref:Uncharacterized protein n=1 Tax=Arundo donax TaxID=35708 RepID=A0A0A9DN68_ARUDO